MATFQYKTIVFQGQFSIVSAFSMKKNRKKLAFILQFAVHLRALPARAGHAGAVRERHGRVVRADTRLRPGDSIF